MNKPENVATRDALPHEVTHAVTYFRFCIDALRRHLLDGMLLTP